MYELLEHWREREKDGLDAIIWNPKCDALNTNEFCPERSRTRSRNRRTSVSAPTVPLINTEASPERAASDSEEENFEVEFQRILDNESEEEPEVRHSDPRHQAPVPYPCTPSIPSNRSHKLMITVADPLHPAGFERPLSPAPSKDINMPGEQLFPSRYIAYSQKSETKRQSPHRVAVPVEHSLTDYLRRQLTQFCRLRIWA